MQYLGQLLLALPCLLTVSTETAHAAGKTERQTAATARAELVERLDQLMKVVIQEDGAVGLSLGVSRGTELIHAAGYGIAELEHGVPVDKDTMFRIGSITKQFTAAAICRLAEDDKLFVDDPITEFVPSFDTQGKEITLRHLLTHTSGIFNYTNLGPVWSDYKSIDLSHEQLLALVAEQPLEFDPGTRWNYSNTGYFLLGMVIEEASGLEYDEYLNNVFFKPLDLTRTRYGSNVDIIPNRAQGYQYLGTGKFANDELLSMEQPYSAGSLLSTGGDLVHWTMALVAGKAVTEESFEEMTLPFMLEDGSDSLYGFGLGLRDVRGKACFSHSGGINGFNSMMVYFPETQLCVAVISNSEGFSSQGVADRVVAELEK